MGGDGRLQCSPWQDHCKHGKLVADFGVETGLMIAYFSKEAQQAVEFHIKNERHEISW